MGRRQSMLECSGFEGCRENQMGLLRSGQVGLTDSVRVRLDTRFSALTLVCWIRISCFTQRTD